jgi:hypothetical protein
LRELKRKMEETMGNDYYNRPSVAVERAAERAAESASRALRYEQEQISVGGGYTNKPNEMQLARERAQGLMRKQAEYEMAKASIPHSRPCPSCGVYIHGVPGEKCERCEKRMVVVEKGSQVERTDDMVDGLAYADMKRQRDELEKTSKESAARANRLSDQCGSLRTENNQLLIENAKLRREVVALQEKARKR